jgi:hypothetical protein
MVVDEVAIIIKNKVNIVDKIFGCFEGIALPSVF